MQGEKKLKVINQNNRMGEKSHLSRETERNVGKTPNAVKDKWRSFSCLYPCCVCCEPCTVLTLSL